MIKKIIFSTIKHIRETRALFAYSTLKHVHHCDTVRNNFAFPFKLPSSNSTLILKFICIFSPLNYSTFFKSFQFHNQRRSIINTTQQCQKQLLLPNKLHETVWPPSQLTCFPPTPPPPPRSSTPTGSPPPPETCRRRT